MKKGLEVRLYPNKEQRGLINRTLGCSRFVYNHVLGMKKELWECPNCHTLLDRDNNAAINILREGLKILSRDTDGRSGRDESLKPADTGLNTNIEQESVTACNKTISHTGKSCLLGQ